MRKRNQKYITAILTGCILLLAGTILSSYRNPERTVEFTYKVKVNNIPEEANKIVVWIPLPRSNSVQELVDFQVAGGVPFSILKAEKHGNRYIYINLSRKDIRDSEISITALFHVNRQSYKNRSAEDDMFQDMETEMKRFLAPDSLVPIDGKIAEEARLVVGNEKDPFKQAKLVFKHIVGTVKYDKSGTGWGKGDALYACDYRAGNCTDFHSLFIGEVRSLGIPARFIMGFPLPKKIKEGYIGGYHCWMEFYIKGRGWIPLDASEARKNFKKRKKYFANLDANRIGFTLGRDISIPQANHTEPLNYIIYPRVEIDGKSYSDIDKEFYFKEI